MNPLVSVGIPAYKPVYLRDAINSILSQTYQNWELIIVDDCSPYHLQDIVSEFNDNRIRYYRNQVNLGAKDPGFNWNKCLEYANGEFFSLLCDDDVYDKRFIEEMLKLADNHSECNVFRSRVKIVDSNQQLTGFFPSSPDWETCEDYMWHVGRSKRSQTISEWMFRTNHIRRYGGYVNIPFAWGADYLSIYRFSLEGGIASTTKLLVSYRENNSSISSMSDKDGLEKLEAIRLRKQMALSIAKENHFLPFINAVILKRNFNENVFILSHMKLSDLIKVLFKRGKFDISTMIIIKSLLMRLYIKKVKD